ncbi:MAG TPA: hydroxysqualene dehydroxylase HpnE [Acetobacteraceae bacterium]|nr:hydroxysqualene dehydroxylase HpnE [Acetobacteraceae bacterium]
MSHVHVIGAGLAGLSAALALTGSGRRVTLYEAGPAAGGRCRSYLDRELGLRIDNGNHLLLSGNHATFAYIDEIGSRSRFGGPGEPLFPFVDVHTGERWVVRPNLGRLPWWILSSRRRVPGSRLVDYLGMAGIARIQGDVVVADAMRRGHLYWRLVEPLAVAALNTRPQVAHAPLLGAVIRETLMQGGKACIPSFPRDGLSEALVDPAVHLLRERGAEVQFGRRVVALTIEGTRVTAIRTTDDSAILEPEDHLVLAVPPWVAVELVPGLTAPDSFESILNIHFRMAALPEETDDEAGFIGMVGGTAEWVFIKPGHVSVTVSAANRLVDEPARTIAALVWPNIRVALALPPTAEMPAFRVVKERRATFAATSVQERRRPGTRTGLPNLVLAGDWTQTGLPATIEGAIRSGRTAAAAILAA